MNLNGKHILITGSARRIGRSLALALAAEGATIILHHGHSDDEAEQTRTEIETLGSKAYILQADLKDSQQVKDLIPQALEYGPLYALVNNAAIFESLTWDTTSLDDWNRHLAINLTAPFLLSQAFASALAPDGQGRIVNILDWRALRPGPDHFPYTISKAALVSLTHSLAAALAPRITVNGMAMGAILPPSTGEATPDILKQVPAGRWADVNEVTQTLVFLLSGPDYITGDIIHIDGGRHLL
ncbi:MAG: SDR family oxidoreductase [Chloroflexota bacterium]|nr:MAG: SDR family oxidoreductase [Chloroflexota bacterium]